jgi:predicted transcriptional regulator
MDVTSTVDSLLLPHIERTVTDAKEKLIEAVRHRYRSQDEIGVLMKFPDRTSLHKTIAEMAELGVIDLKEYVIGKNELSVVESRHLIISVQKCFNPSFGYF